MSQTDLKIPRSQNQLIYDTCAFQKRLYELYCSFRL